MDVVKGEVADTYRDHIISICHGERESEYTSDSNIDYWMACMRGVNQAINITTVVSATVTAAYLLLWWKYLSAGYVIK